MILKRCTLVAVLLSAACSTGGDSSTTQADRSLESMLMVSPHEELARRYEASDLVVACMRGQGWNYKAPDHSQVFFPGGPVLSDPAELREYVEEHGYSIAVGLDTPEPAEETIYIDPNDEYLRKLSKSEREQFLLDLNGSQTVSGCTEEARLVVDSRYQSLQTAYITEVQSRVNRDPRMLQALSQWSECLVREGFGPYLSQSEPIDEIKAEFFAILADVEADDTLTHATASGYPTEIEKSVAAVAEKEVRTALADLECQLNSTISTQAEVRSELEESFMVRHENYLAEVGFDVP